MEPRTSDAGLRLTPPASRTRFWLFALAFALPVATTVVAMGASLLGGSSMALLGGSAPLTVAAVIAGVAVACAALWGGLSWAMRRQSLTVAGDALDVRSSFYRHRMPVAEMKLDQARVVDLDEHTELQPTLKTNGFSIPGFRSGWFLLRNRRRTFVATGDGRRKLWLPGNGRSDMLLDVVDATALLTRLRDLADGRSRG
ncbi:hypothetical protein [Pseudoxanthomonas sp. 10H]|uniref:hypothetical protein n=1 Tax=Pseudoxanthomonas sp. 10H TaxID=3242729 RepID=UPI003557BF25